MLGMAKAELSGIRAALIAAMLVVAAIAALRAAPAVAQEGAPDSSSMNGARNSLAIDLPQLPQVTLQVVPSYGTVPLTCGFLVGNPNPEAGEFESFRWNFGDGQVSTLPPTAFFHTYTQAGSYVVTVTVTTPSGKSATAFSGVTVRPTGLQ